MNSDNIPTFVFAALLFLVWVFLVITDRADAAPLVDAIKTGLLSIGVFHTALTVPPKS